MANVIKITKGLNINLKGKAAAQVSAVRLLLRFLPHLHLKSMDLCLMHSGA